MPIVLPKLPDPDLDETSPYCVIAKHRAKPGKADAYERRMLADLANTRAEPGALQFHIHRDRSDPDLFVIYEVWRVLRVRNGLRDRSGGRMIGSDSLNV
jgi:Antibiotic biosynthesis monooxygenase